MTMVTVFATTADELRNQLIAWCEHKATRLTNSATARYGNKRERETEEAMIRTYREIAEFWRQVQISPLLSDLPSDG